MKILFSFLFLFTNLVNAQQYNRAVYDIEINKSKFENKIKENPYDGYELMLRMVDDANNSNLVLHFKDNLSKCSIEEPLSINNTKSMARGILTFMKAAHDTYYNSKTSVYVEKRGSGDLEHLAQIEIRCFEWDVKNQTKKVNGLTYRKATTAFTLKNQKHNVIAWFAPEVPVQFGPSFFNGLPGLITEVYVTSDESHLIYNYILTKLDYDKKMGDISLPKNKYDLITEEESEELFRKVNEGFNN